MLKSFKNLCSCIFSALRQLTLSQALFLIPQIIFLPIIVPIMKLTQFKTKLDVDTIKAETKKEVLKNLPLIKEFLELDELPLIYDDIEYGIYGGMFICSNTEHIDDTLDYIKNYPSNIIQDGVSVYDSYKCVLLMFSSNIYYSIFNNKYLFRLMTANIVAHELTHYKQFMRKHDFISEKDYIKAEECFGAYLKQPVEREANLMVFKYACKHLLIIIK